MPYMYLPEFEFESFRKNAMDVFDGLECKRTYCYFKSSCADVTATKSIEIHMFSPDTNDSLELEITPDRLLIEQVDPNVPASGVCYLAVFPQSEGRQDAWYLGNLILAEYYIIFDMDGYFNGRTGDLRIGIAKKNPAGVTY